MRYCNLMFGLLLRVRVCPFDYTAVANLLRKPVNQTNQMDVDCFHSIDRPQSVPQLSYNRTLQFSNIVQIKQECNVCTVL